MFAALTFPIHEHRRRSLGLRRRVSLCLEELEERAVPAAASILTFSNQSTTSGQASSATVIQNTQTNQSVSPTTQQASSTPIGNLSTVPPFTTTSAGPVINTGTPGTFTANSLNPGAQVTVYTGNVGTLPPNSSDTNQVGSQTNLLGLTPQELEGLTGPTPLTDPETADFIQVAANSNGLSPLRLALLTVERPDVGAHLGEEAIGGQPIQQQPQQQQPQQPPPAGGAPQSLLDLPEPNLLAILETPPPPQAAPVAEKAETIKAVRAEEPATPAPRLAEVRKVVIPEPQPALSATPGVWDAYFSEEGRGVDLTKIVKMPAENQYEAFTLPWYPPALGFALFLGGWSGISLGYQPETKKQRRALPRLPVKM